MTRPLFHSLGSNYTSKFVGLALGGLWQPLRDRDGAMQKLTEELQNQFQGKAALVYKGRDAIQLALEEVKKNHQDSSKKMAVLTQGLACHAIEEAIVRAGMVPVYVDLEKETLGPSVQTITSGYSRAKKDDLEVCAVLLQHTLGYPNPVIKIRQLCDEKKLVLIEDLAQCFGTPDVVGNDIGLTADIIICSFGRDKIIDAVSGGAVIIRDSYLKKVGKQRADISFDLEKFPPLSHVRKELFYPFLTYLIRNTHSIGVGKVLFQVAKKLQLFTSPIASPTKAPTAMPAAYVPLVLWQLKNLKEQISHRQNIAKIYHDGLRGNRLKTFAYDEMFYDNVYQRFAIICETPQLMTKIIRACAAHNIHLTDRWYREVVDSGSLHLKSLYEPGTCPTAEDTATRLLNLPTHRQISEKDAEWIVEIINTAAAE